MSNTLCEIVWLVRLLADLQVEVPSPIPLFYDNTFALHLARNHVFYERTKHIELDCDFIRQHASSGLLFPQAIASSYQPADILTKASCSGKLFQLSSNLNVLNTLHTPSLQRVIKILPICVRPSSLVDSRRLILLRRSIVSHRSDLIFHHWFTFV